MIVKREETRKKLKELTKGGMLIHINRVCKKNYNLIINGEIVKNYKQRRSCNRYIENLKRE